MTSGVYAITNTATGEQYVGSSKQVDQRWHVHRELLNRGAHVNDLLQAAWNEWHEPVFRFEVLEIVGDRAQLRAREHYYWERLSPAYNLAVFRSTPAKTISITLSSYGLEVLDRQRNRTTYLDGLLRGNKFIAAALAGQEPDQEEWKRYCADAWAYYLANKRSRKGRNRSSERRYTIGVQLSVDILAALDQLAVANRGYFIEHVMRQMLAKKQPEAS